LIDYRKKLLSLHPLSQKLIWWLDHEGYCWRFILQTKKGPARCLYWLLLFGLMISYRRMFLNFHQWWSFSNRKVQTFFSSQSIKNIDYKHLVYYYNHQDDWLVHEECFWTFIIRLQKFCQKRFECISNNHSEWLVHEGYFWTFFLRGNKSFLGFEYMEYFIILQDGWLTKDASEPSSFRPKSIYIPNLLLCVLVFGFEYYNLPGWLIGPQRMFQNLHPSGQQKFWGIWYNNNPSIMVGSRRMFLNLHPSDQKSIYLCWVFEWRTLIKLVYRLLLPWMMKVRKHPSWINHHTNRFQNLPTQQIGIYKYFLVWRMKVQKHPSWANHLRGL
jgi:hypothetical protein